MNPLNVETCYICGKKNEHQKMESIFFSNIPEIKWRCLKQPCNLEQVKQVLANKDCTVPEICKELGITDEFEVISRIGDLESIGDVCFKGFRNFYRPNGYVGYIAVYGCV